jgi:3'(2'), 5'-bisphosphate nucleotidase
MTLSNQNITDILNLLRKAGTEILLIYNTNNFGTRLKEDESPVTIADTTSDMIIKTGLRKITPSIPVFSEETKEIDYKIRASWNPLWILDPLDGTKEFIVLNGEFCISLALVSDGKPSAGFIYAPVTNELWYALSAKGAFKIVEDQHFKLPLKISTGPVVITISRSHFNESEAVWIENLQKKHSTKVSVQGSAIKFCRISEGNADVYPKFGRINEWDVAAGNIIIDESGGEMVELLTRLAPVYNKKNYIQPHFVASGPRLRGTFV